MAMISKTVTGSTEDMKYVKNAKNAPRSAMGGTQRTSFEGSSDPRRSGAAGPNQSLKGPVNYVDAPQMMENTKFSDQFVSGGPKSGSISKAGSPASEDVTRGMGGKVIKDMR
jgi:hypothetical protein